MSENILFIFLWLGLAIIVECGLSLFLKNKLFTYVVFLGNLLTNPLINFVIIFCDYLEVHYVYLFEGYSYLLIVIILEFLTWLTEAFLYFKFVRYSVVKSLALSFVFNAVSFGAGLLCLFVLALFLS